MGKSSKFCNLVHQLLATDNFLFITLFSGTIGGAQHRVCPEEKRWGGFFTQRSAICWIISPGLLLQCQLYFCMDYINLFLSSEND